MSDLFDLSGRVALITGAASGIGQATARAMAAHGAAVVVSDLSDVESSAAADELTAAGHSAVGIGCDVRDRRRLALLVERATAALGAIDVVVYSAGIQGPAGPLEAASDADWDAVLDVNVRSACWLTSLVVPAMAERGGGSVVLMSSIAAMRGNRAIGLYGMSKAALAQLARNLAVEWGPRGVRANAIAPGLIRTPFSAGLLSDAMFMERRLLMTPLRRVGEPDEVAGVAVMLASRAGAFISGQTIVVDGGTTVSDGS